MLSMNWSKKNMMCIDPQSPPEITLSGQSGEQTQAEDQFSFPRMELGLAWRKLPFSTGRGTMTSHLKKEESISFSLNQNVPERAFPHPCTLIRTYLYILHILLHTAHTYVYYNSNM